MKAFFAINLFILWFSAFAQDKISMEAGYFNSATYFKRSANTSVISKIGLTAPSFKIQGKYFIPVNEKFYISGTIGYADISARFAAGEYTKFSSGHIFLGLGTTLHNKYLFGSFYLFGDKKLYQKNLTISKNYIGIQPSVGVMINKRLQLAIETVVYLTPYFRREAIKPYTNRAYWALFGINLGYIVDLDKRK